MVMSLDYDKITIYGDGTMFDYVWVLSDVLTDAELETINEFTYEPKFNSKTILLSNFENNDINGGNISSLTENVNCWSIYRKKPTDTSLTYIGKVLANKSSIIDYTALNNAEYRYYIFAETDNLVSSPLTNNTPIKADWLSWSLVGLTEDSNEKNIYIADEDNIWKFDCDLNVGELTQNIEKYTYDNFTQFPKVSSGAKNYMSTNITALLNTMDENSVDGNYYDTVEMYNKFNEFINSPCHKLLKDRKGNGWIVDTLSNQFTCLTNTSEQAIKVNFDLVQIDDINNVSVIK